MKTAFKEIIETINLPRKSVEQLFETINIFESAQNEIEDFLIVNNKSLMNKIRKARKEHLENKTKDFRHLVKKYV
ncbi:MAG: hypothetical protein AAB564_00855 [Patescibacteria group bacterium]